MEVVQEKTIDLLDQQHPALSATTDMPIIETKPDASPEAPAVVETKVETETPAESATVDTEEEPGVTTEGKKPARGVQKRLDELTKQREEANRRAEAAERRLDEALKIAQQPKVEQEAELVKPVKSDFEDPAQWEEAIIKYASDLATQNAQKEIQKTLQEQERLREEARLSERQKEAREAYTQRLDTTKSKYADFSEVAERADVTLPMPVVQTILSQDDGPELQYYFGKNPDEAKRFLEMNINGQPDVVRQLYELGKISASLQAPKPSISNAPKPISPHRAAPTAQTIDPQNETTEQYAARRKKEQASVRH